MSADDKGPIECERDGILCRVAVYYDAGSSSPESGDSGPETDERDATPADLEAAGYVPLAELLSEKGEHERAAVALTAERLRAEKAEGHVERLLDVARRAASFASGDGSLYALRGALQRYEASDPASEGAEMVCRVPAAPLPPSPDASKPVTDPLLAEHSTHWHARNLAKPMWANGAPEVSQVAYAVMKLSDSFEALVGRLRALESPKSDAD